MPHPGQRAVRLGRKRITYLAAGRRWRKTTLFMSVALEAALHSNLPIVWGAPTFDQVRVGWDEARRAAGGVVEFIASRMTAVLPNGGRIIYRSLDDPDNARGWTAGGVIIDEAADVVAPAWHEVLRPMLMDTHGWALIGGTPKGRNWFWTGCVGAADDPDAAFFQAPTLGVTITAEGLKRTPHPLENPHIPFSEIEHLWRTMPERTFRQEILAEFIEDAGGVFRGVRAAVRGVEWTGEPCVIGVDWARSGDFTVFVALEPGARAVVAVDRFTNVEYAHQRGRLRAFWERYGRGPIMAEANSMGGPVIEQLQREGLPVQPFTTTNASKAAVVDALALAFERRTISLPDHAPLVAELEAFEATRLPSGLIRYAAPESLHDDCVVALCLAWHAATAGQVTYTEALY